MTEPLILASGSPRRRELIGSMGIPFEVTVADAPEIKEGAPEAIVTENARRKAAAVAKDHPGRVVLGADTMVYAAGSPLGKPRDLADARRMLHLLSGREHQVYTGVCVMRDEKIDLRWESARVFFVPLTDAEIDRYLAAGESMDKAGAYGIQGYAAIFTQKIDGDYYNVMGLPVCQVGLMLRRAGIPVLGAEA